MSIFVGTPFSLELYNRCHGNHAISYNPNELILGKYFGFNFGGPNKQVGINYQLS